MGREVRRDTKQPVASINKTYLQNYYYSKHFFRIAYETGVLKNDFDGVMRTQHQILAKGLSGHSPYNGYHPSRSLDQIDAGIFVFDSDYLENLTDNGGLASPGAQMAFFETTTMDIINDHTQQLLTENLNILKDLEDDYELEVDGIPTTDRPRNTLIPDYANKLPSNLKALNYSHEYPKLPFYDPMGGRRLYFERSKALMTKILNESNTDLKLDLIATYYHVAINGHFFVAGNNSILMSQVNVLLQGIGYRPINHGAIAYLALLLNSKQFNQFFKTQLISN